MPIEFNRENTMNLLKKTLIGISILIPSIALAQSSTLPRVNILGKEYLKYEAENGESLYGVSKNLGWDQAIITQYNPELKSPLKKGELIFYPADQVKEITANPGEPIHHTIKKGETVYSISKYYGISTDDIYKINPGAEYGIREGATLLIPAAPSKGNPEVIVHKIQHGETLYSVAKRYNSTVSDIMHENPGVSDHNFKAGSTVKVVPDSRNKNLVKENVVESQLLSMKVYKAKKNDTWQKIAKKFKLDEQVLRAANTGIETPEKDMDIIIPNAVSVSMVKEVPVVDPREATAEGRAEIFEEVQDQLEEEAKSKNVRVAVILDEPDSNKDMEFMRGMLLSVNNRKNSPYKTNLKVISGLNSKDNIRYDLNEFDPNIIITTADRQIPGYIAEYARANDCALVNVFDTRDTQYTLNPEVVQYLAPSDYFNTTSARYLTDNFGTRKLIIAGETETSDGVAEELLRLFNPESVVTIPVDELGTFEAVDGVDYLVYATPTKKADVKDLLDKVKELKSGLAVSNVATVGRPNWITFAGELTEELADAEVYFPSRFYFDSDDSASRTFIEQYRKLYGHTPLKSYPVYAAAGYDVAEYFLPAIHQTGGNLAKSNASGLDIHPLQNSVSLTPIAGGGLLNSDIYMLKFGILGGVEKIIVK